MPQDTMTLDQMPPGATGTVQLPSSDAADAALLRAMGLREGLPIRVCRTGEPCIVEVDGTRLGIAKDISVQVQVVTAPAI